MRINRLGYLLDDDISLRDSLTLDEINYIDFGTVQAMVDVEITNPYDNMFKVVYNRVAGDFNLFEKGIVFINSNRGNNTLVGVIKNPILTADMFEFYVASTNYGFFDDFGDNVKVIIEDNQFFDIVSSSKSNEILKMNVDDIQYFGVTYET